MPFSRPALADLIARVTQQVQAGLPGIDPTLRRNMSSVLGQVLAQELNLEYGYLDYIALTAFTATAPGGYLDYKGNPYGITRLPAIATVLAATAAGVPGSLLPSGSVLQTADGSISFATQADATISGGGTIAVSAASLAGGAASNVAAGSLLTLVVAIAGINALLTVTAITIQGVDAQSDASYRAAILARQQLPPQGGAPRDYVTWTKTVPGVTRVWVYPLNRGAGTVDVAPVFDARGGSLIVANSADQATVAATLVPLKPVTASAACIALTPDVHPIAIAHLTALTGFSVATALANATASLANLFASATPGGATYGDGIQPGQTGGTTFLGDIYDAIKQSAGVYEFDLTSPSADIVSAAQHIAALGAVTNTP